MNVRRIATALRARWFVIAAVALVGLIVAGALLLAAPRSYSATTRLYLGLQGAESSSELAQGGDYTEKQAQSFAVVATSSVVLRPVVQTLDLPTTSTELATRVSAQVPAGTSIIDVTVVDARPARAAATADAVATSLGNAVTRLSPTRSDGANPLRLSVVQRAVVPDAPTDPHPALILLLGLIGGAVLGGLIAVAAESVVRPVRTPDDIARETDAPVLGTIVLDPSTPRHAIVSGDGFRAEQYRQLRAVVAGLDVDGRVVVTSALPREGKSVLAVNLAHALASSGRRVCLVDANLRGPSVARLLGVPDVTGLTSVVTEEMDVMSALTTATDLETLSVLPAGPSVSNPSELLDSPLVATALDQLDDEFDYVVVDTPSLLAYSDALEISDRSGGAIIVAGSGQVRAEQLRDAVGTLESPSAVVRGVVLNRVPARAFGARLRHAHERSGQNSSRGTPPGT